MSFMVPICQYTESGSAPILASEYPEATLVQRMLFIALVTGAQISPNISPPHGWLLPMYKKTSHYTYNIHARSYYIHDAQHIFLYITFMHAI
jgi:hypothetical protein